MTKAADDKHRENVDRHFKDYRPTSLCKPPLYVNPKELNYITKMKVDDEDNKMMVELEAGESSRKNQTAKLVELFKQAYNETIRASINEAIKRELNEAPRLVFELGVNTENFPYLISHNAGLGSEILLKMAEAATVDLTEYYNILVEMDVSVDSMEAINKLLVALLLPDEYLHRYIYRCMEECGKLTGFSQIRMARLVVIFVDSILRNLETQSKLNSLMPELQAFCLEYAKIKEATSLYAYTKQMEVVAAQKLARRTPEGRRTDSK